MKRGIILLVGVFGAPALILAWPAVRNLIATAQARRVETFEARLIIFNPKMHAIGPVRLNADQRRRLLNLMDWDYVLLGRSLRGFPSCMVEMTMQFTPAVTSDHVMIEISSCETINFSGRVAAGGYNPGIGHEWKRFTSELFPRGTK